MFQLGCCGARSKSVRKNRALNFMPGLIVLVCCFAGKYVRADDFTARSYPAPVNVDTSFVRSGMYLRFEARDYNLSIDEFAKRVLTPEETLFVRVAQNIHTRNHAALAEIWGDPRPKKATPTGSVQISEMTPQQVVAEYAPDFADLQKPKLVMEVLAGSATLFIWETSSDGTPTRLGFQVIADTNKKLWIKDIDSVRDPIPNLIVLTTNEMLHDPAAYKPTDNPGTKYRYAFPLESKTNPGKHPVLLQFSGTALNFPVYEERTAAPTPLLSAYRSSYLAFKAKRYDEFIAAHTPESQTKLKQLIPTLSGNSGPQIIQRLTANKYVKFVITADPVYFVFYSALQGEDWPSGSLGYSYMYHDPASGKFLLTNLLVQGFWDQVFKDPDLFNQLIFKPAIKPGLSKSQKSK